MERGGKGGVGKDHGGINFSRKRRRKKGAGRLLRKVFVENMNGRCRGGGVQWLNSSCWGASRIFASRIRAAAGEAFISSGFPSAKILCLHKSLLLSAASSVSMPSKKSKERLDDWPKFPKGYTADGSSSQGKYKQLQMPIKTPTS